VITNSSGNLLPQVGVLPLFFCIRQSVIFTGVEFAFLIDMKSLRVLTPPHQRCPLSLAIKPKKLGMFFEHLAPVLGMRLVAKDAIRPPLKWQFVELVRDQSLFNTGCAFFNDPTESNGQPLPSVKAAYGRAP